MRHNPCPPRGQMSHRPVRFPPEQVERFARATLGIGVLLALALLLGGKLSLAAPCLSCVPSPNNAPVFDLAPLYPSPNERLGFGVTGGINNVSEDVLGSLNAGWYVNWGSAPTVPHPNGLTYVQIIRLRQNDWWPNGQELLDIIHRNPGSLWLIGNEPDSPFQDNQTPEQYVEKYHALYTLIKREDPTALVAIGGVIQATPLRLRYLDLIWEGYRERYGMEMPVDVWNVHNFILREARVYCSPGGVWGAYIPPGLPDDCGEQYTIGDHDNMEIFRRQIYAFRQWMKDKGQQNKPHIVSEYGILFPDELGFSQERVERFMLATFDFFLNARDPDLGYPLDDGRLVQQWAWFSLDDVSFEWGTTHSALYDPNQKQLTPLGRAFAGYAARQRVPYVDLSPGPPAVSQTVEMTPIPFGGTGEVSVQVPVNNLGNTPGNGQVRLSRVTESGALSVGVRAVEDVPTRYAGARTVTFVDRIATHAPVRYRAQVTSSQDARAGNNTEEALFAVDVALAALVPQGAGYAPAGDVARVRVRVTVANRSGVALADVPVRVVRATTPGDTLAEGKVAVVPAWGTASVTLTWEAPLGEHRVRALVDPDNRVQEGDETNNAAEATVWVLSHRAVMPYFAVGGKVP